MLLRSGLRLPRALRKIVLIESLPYQRLDYGLAAHVQIPSGSIQFFQHGRCEVHIYTLDRLNHSALTFEETRYIFPSIG